MPYHTQRKTDKTLIPFRKTKGKPLYEEELSFNKDVQRIRWRVEAMFSRLKSFSALHCTYRHDIAKHRLVSLAVVACYNVDILFQPLSL